MLIIGGLSFIILPLPEAIFYKIYMDFITMLILEYYILPSYQFSHLVELLLVRYSNACLRLFVVILQDLHCLQRFYHH